VCITMIDSVTAPAFVAGLKIALAAARACDSAVDLNHGPSVLVQG
jgi:hypothetical protein